MAGSGKADKGRKQQKKKPQHTLKEKRKLKEEKKNKASTGLGQFGFLATTSESFVVPCDYTERWEQTQLLNDARKFGRVHGSPCTLRLI